MFDINHSGGALGRDVLMAEVQQLAGALARLLFDVQAAPPEQATEVLEEGIGRTLGLSLGTLRTLPRERLLALGDADGAGLDAATRLALADVLALDATPEGRQRALWLYEAALSGDAAVPMDLFERLQALRASLG